MKDFDLKNFVQSIRACVTKMLKCRRSAFTPLVNALRSELPPALHSQPQTRSSHTEFRCAHSSAFTLAEVTTVILVMLGIILLAGRLAVGDRQKEYNAKFDKISTNISSNISHDLISKTGFEFEDYITAVKGNDDFQAAVMNNIDGAACNDCWSAGEEVTIGGKQYKNLDNSSYWNFYKLNDNSIMAVNKKNTDILIDVNGVKGPNAPDKDVRAYKYPAVKTRHGGDVNAGNGPNNPPVNPPVGPNDICQSTIAEGHIKDIGKYKYEFKRGKICDYVAVDCSDSFKNNKPVSGDGHATIVTKDYDVCEYEVTCPATGLRSGAPVKSGNSYRCPCSNSAESNHAVSNESTVTWTLSDACVWSCANSAADPSDKYKYYEKNSTNCDWDLKKECSDPKVLSTDKKSCVCEQSEHEDSESDVLWSYDEENTCEWTPTCAVPSPGDGVIASPKTTETYKNSDDKWACRCKNYDRLYIAWKESRDILNNDINSYDKTNSRSLRSVIELRWGEDIAKKLDQDRSFSSNKNYQPKWCGGMDRETKDNVIFGNRDCTSDEIKSINNGGIPSEDVQAYILAYDGNTVTTIGYIPRSVTEYGTLGNTSRISTDIGWSDDKISYFEESLALYKEGKLDANMTNGEKHKFYYHINFVDDMFTGTITIDGCTYNADAYYRQQTPLVFDLKGDGFKFTSVEDGANFDIDADGNIDRTGWTAKQEDFDDAFLVLDKNNNGQIDNGAELFGDQNGEENGYKELAKYDNNNDGKIDKNDAVYSQLRLWADINGDGKVDQPQEWKTLEEMGITEISTGYNKTYGENGNNLTDEYGNDISLQSTFKRIVSEVVDGIETAVEKIGQTVDVFFNYLSNVFR